MPVSALSHGSAIARIALGNRNPAGRSGAPDPQAFAAALQNAVRNSGNGGGAAQAPGAANPLAGLTQLLKSSLASSPLGLDRENGVDSIAAQTQRLKQQFQAAFRKLLDDQGIELGGGVSLQVGAHGDIRVANDHPDKLFIESALKNDPELSNLFRKISANSSLLHAAEQAAKFQQAYGVDPQRAVEEYRRLFGDQSPQTFSLTITEQGIETSFTQLQADASQPVL